MQQIEPHDVFSDLFYLDNPWIHRGHRRAQEHADTKRTEDGTELFNIVLGNALQRYVRVKVRT